MYLEIRFLSYSCMNCFTPLKSKDHLKTV